MRSEIEQIRGDQREDDRGVRLDHEARRVDVELAPRDLLVGRRAAVRAVRRGGIGDLAEVAPGARRCAAGPDAAAARRRSGSRPRCRRRSGRIRAGAVLSVLLVPVDQRASCTRRRSSRCARSTVAARCRRRRTCCRASSPPSRARRAADRARPRRGARSRADRSGTRRRAASSAGAGRSTRAGRSARRLGLRAPSHRSTM